MKTSRGLLALAVVAMAVIAVIVFSYSSGPAVSSTSEVSVSTSTSTISTVSTSATLNPSQGLASFLAKNISTVSQFFKSVRAFTIVIGSGSEQQLSSTNQSWTYVASPVINGTSYTEVSVACSGSQSCEYPSPYTLWVADDGTIPMIEYNGTQYSYNFGLYSGGPTIGLEEMLFFSAAPYLTGVSPSDFVPNGAGYLQAGPVRIPTYTWSLSTQITYSGTSVSQASITLGVLPSGNVILVRLVATGTKNGASASATVDVTSLTLA
jgi:hypothetical protein